MENENRCVICGAIIPEGIQVCYTCIMDIEESSSSVEIKEKEFNKKKKKFLIKNNTGNRLLSWLSKKQK